VSTWLLNRRQTQQIISFLSLKKTGIRPTPSVKTSLLKICALARRKHTKLRVFQQPGKEDSSLYDLLHKTENKHFKIFDSFIYKVA